MKEDKIHCVGFSYGRGEKNRPQNPPEIKRKNISNTSLEHYRQNFVEEIMISYHDSDLLHKHFVLQQKLKGSSSRDFRTQIKTV